MQILRLLGRHLCNITLKCLKRQITTLSVPDRSVSDITSSIFEVTKDINHGPRSSTKVMKYVSSFYQNVKIMNLEQISRILTDIANDMLKRDDNVINNCEFYFNCLKIGLNCFSESTSTEALYLLRNNIEDYRKVIVKFRGLGTVPETVPYSEMKNIQNLFLKTILHLYSVSKQSGKSRIITNPITEYFLHNLKSFDTDIQEFANELTQEESLQKALTEICFEKQISLPVTKTSIEREPYHLVSIDQYLDEYGGIDYENICKYISDYKFTWRGQYINDKLFNYYDTLSTEEKSQFMEAYLDFNKSKELIIEKYTNRIVHVSLEASKQFEKSFKFGMSEKNLIHKWITDTTEQIEKILASETSLSNEEIIIHQFKPFLETVTIQSIINYIIFSILGSPDGKLTTVIEKMKYSFPSVLSQHASPNLKGEVFQYINDDAYIKLTHQLVKLIIENCKVPITSKQMEQLQNSLKLENKEIADQFLISSGGNDDEYPAFCKETKRITNTKNKTYIIVKMHPYIELKLQSLKLGTHLHYLPMLHPPKPWVNPQSGGYLAIKTSFVSTNDSIQVELLNRAGVRGQLDNAYSCLDQMGNTAWAINPLMLDVFNKLMGNPDGFLSIPPLVPDETLPQKTKTELKSLRITFEIMNKLANAFGENGDLLYHCYSLDFRGRVYPFSPLTHYRGDLARSLFMFWYSEPLGPNGFYWIKYQLASLFGQKNCLEFYEENYDNIIDSARNPMTGKKWWMKADKPFSALAVCFEIKKILDYRMSGGKIEDYKCRLPIHQDGSCNGLQHYAGLAADETGGAAVNLIRLETKQDVYTKVLEIVKKKIEQDILEQNLGTVNLETAKFFLPILNRKLVKRPVMTTVYGVTLAGASSQIMQTIKEIVEDHRTNPSKTTFSNETLHKLKSVQLTQTSYLAKKILDSIDELFVHAKQIEKWLLQNTKRILTSYNIKTIDHLLNNNPSSFETIFTTPMSFFPMSWISPCGLPVIQAYRKIPTSRFNGAIGKTTWNNSNKLSPMDRRKHELGIAPNFIHSLDAAHLFMTCDSANKAGLTFSAIHDSYWTHPNNVEKLSKILREQFVELYSMDYLKYVRQDFINQVKNSYQLVYFKKKDYPGLVNKIAEIRKHYPERKKPHKLAFELREMTEQGEEHIMRKLYQQYKPRVFHIVSDKCYEYRNDTVVQPEPKCKGMMEIFVPVLIINVPPKGNLDISKVLDSPYFFS